MGASAKRGRVLVAVACLAAMFVVGEPGASASGGGGGSGSFAAGGPAVDATRASITLTPTLSWPPNALCDSLGLGADSTVQVDGTAFKFNKPYTLLLGTKVVGSGTTSATGTVSTTFEDVQQPFGTYQVAVQIGAKKKAKANLDSSAQSCWSSSGTSGTPLAWNWSGSGFDAGSTATIKVDGAAIQTATATSKGQFTKAFNASCPVGARPVTLVASFGGVVAEYPFGTASC